MQEIYKKIFNQFLENRNRKEAQPDSILQANTIYKTVTDVYMMLTDVYMMLTDVLYILQAVIHIVFTLPILFPVEVGPITSRAYS